MASPMYNDNGKNKSDSDCFIVFASQNNNIEAEGLEETKTYTKEAKYLQDEIEFNKNVNELIEKTVKLEDSLNNEIMLVNSSPNDEVMNEAKWIETWNLDCESNDLKQTLPANHDLSIKNNPTLKRISAEEPVVLATKKLKLEEKNDELKKRSSNLASRKWRQNKMQKNEEAERRLINETKLNEKLKLTSSKFESLVKEYEKLLVDKFIGKSKSALSDITSLALYKRHFDKMNQEFNCNFNDSAMYSAIKTRLTHASDEDLKYYNEYSKFTDDQLIDLIGDMRIDHYGDQELYLEFEF